MIIVLANQKGGTAKTTTSLAIWNSIPNSLGIDLDIQGNFSFSANADKSCRNIYNVLMGECSVQEAVQKLELGDFISSSPRLAGIRDLSPFTLSKALAPLKKKYQYIILDTPPGLSNITDNALTAADILIIPAQADIYSLCGLEQVKDFVDAIHQETNPNLKIAGILLTRFSSRSPMRQQMRDLAEEYAANMGTHVFKTAIREGIAIPKSQVIGKDIFSYKPHENVTADYRAFMEELKGVLQ